MNLKNTTLGSIAIEIPMATTIFRKYNLDYCCGGKQSLKEACAEKGIPVDEIIVQLEGLERVQDQTLALAPGGITGFIVQRYHEDLRKRLPGLIALAEKVETAHSTSPHFPEGLVKFLREITFEMFEHMNKEENVLFPMINAGESIMIKGPISRMEIEHEHHGKNLRYLKELTNSFQPPAEACTAWKALYRGLEELESELMAHINLENNVLFPRALNSLMP